MAITALSMAFLNGGLANDYRTGMAASVVLPEVQSVAANGSRESGVAVEGTLPDMQGPSNVKAPEAPSHGLAEDGDTDERTLEEGPVLDGSSEQGDERDKPDRAGSSDGDRTDPAPGVSVPGGIAGIRGIVTHYGESYNGLPLGCGNAGKALETAKLLGGHGDGIYRSSDPTIAASAWRPDGTRAYPCGTVLRVSGQAGSISVVVGDACPGCTWSHLDLSEAGITAVCGGLWVCNVTITRE